MPGAAGQASAKAACKFTAKMESRSSSVTSSTRLWVWPSMLPALFTRTSRAHPLRASIERIQAAPAARIHQIQRVGPDTRQTLQRINAEIRGKYPRPQAAKDRL